MKIIGKILGLLVVLFLLFLGTSYVALSTGNQVETVWSEEDFVSGVERSQIVIDDIEEINLENLTRGNFSTSGENQIDEQFTQEEISALLSMANENRGPLKDIKVSFTEDGNIEASFRLSENFIGFLRKAGVIPSMGIPKVYASDNIFGENSSDPSLTDMIVDYVAGLVNNKPVYATGQLYRDSENSVQLNIETLHVGRAPLPRETIEKVEYETVRVVNAIIARENGFHIEELQFRDGKMYYRGTLPEEIEGVRL